MADELIECQVCDGLGSLPCDDGSEIQCTHCDGTGKVPAEKVEIMAGTIRANAPW
jgi:DnaJ-class molecular chaperone